MSAPSLVLAGVAKDFPTPDGETYRAVRDIDLEVADGRFVAVVGPSGCGKSTLLNVAAGLTPPSEGHIEVFGQRLSGINRRAAYIFQQDALLPWKTVLANVMLGPQLRGLLRSEIEPEARRWLQRVGLSGFEGHFPYQLSGGMRKRVAIAQCWITGPDILLMDEPFSALDVQTRQMMENELLAIWSAERKTVLFVTHDLEEAISLADEVVVLSAGPASTVVGRYEVELARPRNLMEIRTDPGFLRLYERIWATLREEVLKSHERSQALSG